MLMLLGGNAWVVRTVDVILLSLALLLGVELIETRLLRLLIVLLIVVVVLLLQLLRRSDGDRWCDRRITRVMLRSLAAYVGSGG